MKVPPAARRLFPHLRGSLLELDESRDFVIARLLEGGDSADLTALFSQHPETTVRRVFVLRGSRQVDRRSRAFWSLLFSLGPVESSRTAEELWPL